MQSSMDLIVLSCTNSNLLYRQRRHNCNPKNNCDIIVTQKTTVVFGNISTVVASCKTLHWTQMTNGSNVSKHEKCCFSHNLQKISKLWKISEKIFLSEFFYSHMKNSLKKNYQKKHFCQKRILRSCEKQCFLHLEHI